MKTQLTGPSQEYVEILKMSNAGKEICNFGFYGQVLAGEIGVLFAQPEVVDLHPRQVPNFPDTMSEVKGMEELTNTMPKTRR